jgi:hypothetical protein
MVITAKGMGNKWLQEQAKSLRTPLDHNLIGATGSLIL